MWRRMRTASSLTMVRGCRPPNGRERAGSVRSTPATAALSAWACTSSSLASRASVMALRASLSNWPTAGFSSLGTFFMPVWARVNSPFLPRMATRASSTPRLSDAWAMRARASRWMRTISSFIKFDGQELTRPPRQRQALRAGGTSLRGKWRHPEKGERTMDPASQSLILNHEYLPRKLHVSRPGGHAAGNHAEHAEKGINQAERQEGASLMQEGGEQQAQQGAHGEADSLGHAGKPD